MHLVVLNFKVLPLGTLIKLIVPDVGVASTDDAVVLLVVPKLLVEALHPLLLELSLLAPDDLGAPLQEVGQINFGQAVLTPVADRLHYDQVKVLEQVVEVVIVVVIETVINLVKAYEVVTCDVS